MLAEEHTSIIFTTVQCILLIAGIYLQIRIFIVLHREKDSNLPIYVIHGVIILIYHPSVIFMHSAAQFLRPLSHFTGTWFCDVASFIKLFGMVQIHGHSIVTALYKYIFIVCKEKMDRFGNGLANIIFCVFYVSVEISIALSWLYNSYVMELYPLYGACLGTEKEMTKNRGMYDYNFIQPFKPVQPNTPLEYVVYITTEGSYHLVIFFGYLGLSNMLEALVYYKIFHFIYR